jgi:hypothetical protein
MLTIATPQPRPSWWTARIGQRTLQFGQCTFQDVLRSAALDMINNGLVEEFKRTDMTVTQWLLAKYEGLSVEFLRSVRSTPGRVPKRELLEWVDYLEHGGRYEE